MIPHARHYCLFCFATLPDGDSRCEACDRVTSHLDRRVYWSRHPKHVQDERACKIAIIVLLAAVAMLSIWMLRRATGPAAGYVGVLPILLGYALWQTVSKLTRHETTFRPVVFWPVVFLAAGTVAAVVGAWPAAAAGLGLAALALWLARRGDRWKHDLIAGARVP